MLSIPALVSVVQWLGERLLDGTWLAAAAWLASVTLLKRASGRLLSFVWLSVLVGFVVARPFTLRATSQRLLPLGVPGLELLRETTESRLEGWLFAAYAGTVCFLMGRLCLRHWQLKRRVASYDVADPATRASVASLARTLALSALPDVRVTDEAVGPFTFGPGNPRLILPRWLCVPGTRLDAVLLHELSHLQRKDHWWIWLQRAVTALYFFWPPVYWVSRKLEDARELACDEQAIGASGMDATQYSDLLLCVVTSKRETQARYAGLHTLGTLALGPSARRLEWRLSRLLDTNTARRPPILERGCTLLLCIGLLLSVRPARESAESVTAKLPLSADVNSQSPRDVWSDGTDMCLPLTASAACVLQRCGTLCAP